VQKFTPTGVGVAEISGAAQKEGKRHKKKERITAGEYATKRTTAFVG